MNVSMLFDQFDLLLDAPGSVPKLRELILDLAVRGMLVAQDPDDEPASNLLERIEQEKGRLYKEGKIRKPQTLPRVKEEEMVICLPEGWAWVRLGHVIELISGQHIKSSDYSERTGAYPYMTGPADFGPLYPNISKWTDHPKVFAQTGDVLVTVKGAGVGKTNVLNVENVALGRQLMAVRGIHTNVHFLYWLLTSKLSLFQELSDGTTVPGISRNDILDLPVALPPIGEQKRIVTKVDELMRLCDELEAQQTTRQSARIHLNNASLNALQTAEEAEFSGRWGFVRDHFELLYDDPQNVQALRQAVLQLAVRGKLVEPDPTDEPATVLLERIEEERRRLYKEGKIRKPKKLSRIKDDEPTFRLPTGWKWARFGAVTFNRDGERIPVSRAERAKRPGPYDYYGASGVIDCIDGYLFEKPLLLIGEDGANLLLRSKPIAFIATGQYWVNNHAHVIDGLSHGLLQYLEIYINAIDLAPYVTGTAQPKMNQAKMNSIVVAIPPHEEQKRIVAKVDELMRLCDELETQLVRSQEKAARLLEAVLREVLLDNPEPAVIA